MGGGGGGGAAGPGAAAGRKGGGGKRPSPAEARDALFAFNSLLHYLSAAGAASGQPLPALKQALGLYREMWRGGLEADAVSFNTLISACALVPDVGTASQLFSDMVGALLLCAAVYNSKSETHTLTAPAVVYLLGARYCLLRCKEVHVVCK